MYPEFTTPLQVDAATLLLKPGMTPGTDEKTVFKIREARPINCFLENLRDFSTLEKLDLSLNMLDAESCLILEAVLYENEMLRELVMTDNAVGADGARALLRVLCVSSVLKSLKLTKLANSAFNEAASSQLESQGGALEVYLSERDGIGYDERKGGGGHTVASTRAEVAEEERRAAGRPAYCAELPQRISINPAKAKKEFQLEYSKYSFLHSMPMGFYQVDLRNPADRALIYLLLRARDQIPGAFFAMNVVEEMPQEAFFEICSWSQEKGRWQVGGSQEKGRWQVGL